MTRLYPRISRFIIENFDFFFPEIRYGYPGSTEMEVRKEMFDLDAHLQSERFTYAWISSANAEYEEALTQIHFLSNIHAKVLDVKLSSKEIVPEEDANYWIDLVFNNSTSGLTQSLATLNSVIQGEIILKQNFVQAV